MIVLGLTGSIGMGKSTAAADFRRLGIPVHDADVAVHRLLEQGGVAVPVVEAAFPGVTREGAIDRAALGQRVFDDNDALDRLEALLHPLVWRDQERFLAHARALRKRLVVLDIPLLFETGAERRCDAVAVVTAPRFLQEHRVLTRPGMDRTRLRAVLARQMPDPEKRRRADFVIRTGLGRARSLRDIRKIIRRLMEIQGLP